MIFSEAVATHQFSLRKNVSLHGALDIGLSCTGLQTEFRVKRVQLEEIPVGFPRRGARAAVTNFSEIVSALPSTARKLFLFRDTFREFARVRGQVIDYPVHPRANRRVGIIDVRRKRQG